MKKTTFKISIELVRESVAYETPASAILTAALKELKRSITEKAADGFTTLRFTEFDMEVETVLTTETVTGSRLENFL